MQDLIRITNYDLIIVGEIGALVFLGLAILAQRLAPRSPGAFIAIAGITVSLMAWYIGSFWPECTSLSIPHILVIQPGWIVLFIFNLFAFNKLTKTSWLFVRRI